MSHEIKVNLDNAVVAINTRPKPGNGGGRYTNIHGNERRENFRSNTGRQRLSVEIRQERCQIQTQRNTDDVWIRRVFTGPRNSPAKEEVYHRGTKLMLSNIPFEITGSEIRVLFEQFGFIKRAVVHYNRLGRALGTAEVIFEKRTDAINAMVQYNGVLLNGHVLNIHLTTSNIPTIPHNKRPLDSRGRSTKDIPRQGGRSRDGEKFQNQLSSRGKGRHAQDISSPVGRARVGGKFQNQLSSKGKGKSAQGTSRSLGIVRGGEKFKNKLPPKDKIRCTQEIPNPAGRDNDDDSKFKNISPLLRRIQSTEGISNPTERDSDDFNKFQNINPPLRTSRSAEGNEEHYRKTGENEKPTTVKLDTELDYYVKELEKMLYGT